METMIKGFWQTTTLVCGNHPSGEEVVMTLQQGPKNIFYACPKYHPENRSADEAPCANRISLKEFEGMLNEIFAVLEKAEETNTVLNLKNYTWKKRGLEFKVLAHDKDSIRVSVINRRALV